MSHNRDYGQMTSREVGTDLTDRSILCLPIGSIEQHGPHLPLYTDTIIAEQFTRRLIERFGDNHDLFILPSIPYGLSYEHVRWPGTVSLTTAQFADLLDALVSQYVRTTPARRLLIVNGHGGNRGVLDTAAHELREHHALTTCVIHAVTLAAQHASAGVPEVHAGLLETSLMLALAPSQVHLERLDRYEDHRAALAEQEVRRQILDRAISWPWDSADPDLGHRGVIGGNPRQATAEHGATLIGMAIDSCTTTIEDLRRGATCQPNTTQEDPCICPMTNSERSPQKDYSGFRD